MDCLLYSIVIFLCLKHVEGTYLYKHQEKDTQKRFRRWMSNEDCSKHEDAIPETSTTFKGYQSLTRNQVHVEFYEQDVIPKHIAKVNWTIPQVPDAPKIIATSIYLGMNGNSPYACNIIHNETFITVEPSSGWKYDEPLRLMIIPLPSKTKFTANILDFKPVYVKLKISPANVSTTSKGNVSQTFDVVKNEANINKVIVGSVTGVIIAIIIIILMIVYYKRRRETENNSHYCEHGKDFYYVSYYPENKNFTKEVENFVGWGRQKGFNMQMDSEMSPENRQILREEGPMRFIDNMLRQAKNVFMIVSPLYLKLCLMDEQDTLSQKKVACSQEENTIYYEIVSIKNDLVSKMFRGGRFIPVLFNVKDTQLPFWMKELVLYSWPKDANKLLYRLHNLPECMPVKYQSQNTK